ncbi:MAG: RNA polymerase sigma factor [Planctomycetota bacterium]|jgi:RNA polymerase sigma-70 factor (ECF subfamily)
MELEQPPEKIVRRCQNGQRAAFEELFEIYQPRLKYYVRRLDTGDNNSDDILQDIWLTVFKKIHKLKEEMVPVSDSDEPVFEPDDAEKLLRALNTLKTYHREVLTLYFIEQMSYQSIADVIDCSVGTVRSRLFYAKQSLRQEMERQNEQ